MEPQSIIRIEDREGTPLYETSIESKQVYYKFNSNLVDMMKGIVKYGTGKLAQLPRPVAGKQEQPQTTEMLCFQDLYRNLCASHGSVMTIILQRLK